jgi:hypothetical protein
VGAFLALATLPPPIALTGAVGAWIGDHLRSLFGVGVAAIPLIPLFWSVALFGHFDRPISRRVTILLAGLALTVPSGITSTRCCARRPERGGCTGVPADRSWAFCAPPGWPVGEGLLLSGRFLHTI